MFKRYDIDSLDNRNDEVLLKLVRWLRTPLKFYFHPRITGLNRIPDGPGLYVANHSSGLITPDSFIICTEILKKRGLKDLPFGLGHEIAIRFPIIHQLIMPLGAVRASHENAHRLFERGHKAIVYPGGDLDNMRPYSKRDEIIFGGRKGYMRLALRESVPIIPIISAGAHETFRVLTDGRTLAKWFMFDKVFRSKVFPLWLGLPWGLGIGPLTLYIPLPVRIFMEVLDPIHFDPSGPEAAADESYVAHCAHVVETTMQTALTRLAEERRHFLRKRRRKRFGKRR